MQILPRFLLLLLSLSTSEALDTDGAPYGLYVNHERSEALAINPAGILLGWAVGFLAKNGLINATTPNVDYANG